MKIVCVLALCAIGAVSGTENVSTGTTNRHQRSTGKELFLSIVGERPSGKGNVNAPILPVQLPIQLGGHGGVTLPVLVVPVPVYINNPDSCSANHHNVPAKPADPAQAPLPNIPYVQIRNQFTQGQSTSDSPVNTRPQKPETAAPQYQKPQPIVPQPQEAEPVAPQPQQPEPVVHQAQEPKPFAPQHQEPQPEVPQPIQINQLEETQPEKPSHFTVNSYKPVKTYSSNKIIIKAPTVTIPGIPAHKGSLNLNLDASGNKINFKVDTQTSNTPEEPVSYEQTTSVVEEEKIPFSDGSPIFETSEQMIQSFLRQSPVAPELPAVIPDLSLPDRIPFHKSSSVNSSPIKASSPPTPDFNRSLHLRVDLTVPQSDYTEAYDIQWHAETNTARTVVEDGSTVAYRAPLADGRIQFLEIRLERADGQFVRHCTLSPLMPASPADKRFPGLPETDQFEFTGYTSAEGRSLVERWRRVVVGGPGEGGAAEGESLTFTHEMLIIRDRGEAVPLRYTVVTDSSVLGPASDSYTHRYREHAAPAAAVLPDLASECDVFDEFHDPDHHEHHEHHDQEHHDHEQHHEHYEQHYERHEQHYEHHEQHYDNREQKHHDHEGKREQRDIGSFLSGVVPRFDPIREFAGPTRDIRYDSILTKFKKQFKRKYLDPAEEAVRKNLLVKSSRFIEAGNRLASGFKMAANFLADRLDDEINQLFGVQAPPEGASEPGLVPFPYSDNELKKISNELDDKFDWRPLGAVSPVRFQETTCSSCWAFAVAGSTEGALFKKTNKLVPLSPQCLVDCGKPFGTNGCNGTWPSFAYDYVQARGLPAWDEYTNYQAKVLECKDKIVPPVTHISGHVNVTAFSESALKVAIKNHAPNVVIVDAKANSFIYYKSGVLKDKRCGENKPKLNHAVLAVGWGTKDGPHFIIKNTWTSKWGEEGYIRIAPDSCAVLERPSYALIEQPDIDREELRAAAASVKA